MAAWRVQRSNADLVASLCSDGVIQTDVLADAFLAVDRGLFLPSSVREKAYRDEPIRSGIFHLSAPHVYASVLEALQLRPGLSFLNIGSGSGYLSHIVASIVGPGGISHGVELHSELVEFASTRCSACESLKHLNFISFAQGDAFQLDSNSQTYDRVYVGAGSTRQYSALLHSLLNVGGIMVVPQGSSLLFIKREDGGTFHCESIANVHFKSLKLPPIRTLRDLPKFSVLPSPDDPGDTDEDHRAALHYTFSASIVGKGASEGFAEPEIIGFSESTATIS